MTTRILVVDDHPLMREGLRELLRPVPEFEVVAEAESIAGALQALDERDVDVVVLDLTLGGEDGVDLLKRIAQDRPAVRVLILSMHDEMLYAEQLLQRGAHGYLMKHESATVLIDALRTVARGEVFLSAAVGPRLLGKPVASRDPGAPLAGLTKREFEVLRAIGQGLGTRDIAAQLGMSAKTVDSHRRNVREKLGLHSPTDLVRYARRWATENPPDPSAEA